MTSLVMLVIAAIGASPASATGPVAEQSVNPRQSAVESSWTRDRMLNAIPAEPPGAPAPSPAISLDVPTPGDASVSARSGDFLVKDPTALPKRLHGKVFFRVGSKGFTCSGTVVSSRYGNAIYTAGHCVFDRSSKRFVSDLAFAPAYQNGALPLGIYAATHLLTTRGWAQHGSLSHDIGMATLGNYPTGPIASNLGGARPVAFNLNPRRNRYTTYGYPEDPKPIFTSEYMYGCQARFAGRDRGVPRTLAVTPCHMGHGASGGGWITKGYLNSVQSYSYCESKPRTCAFVFGPYFGKAARQLYMSKTIGGSINPGIAILSGPRKVRKRKVHFRLFGLASTPLRYQCRLDRHRWKRCGKVATVAHLRPGRHIMRVRAFDQTGRRSANIAKRGFRVLHHR